MTEREREQAVLTRLDRLVGFRATRVLRDKARSQPDRVGWLEAQADALHQQRPQTRPTNGEVASAGAGKARGPNPVVPPPASPEPAPTTAARPAETAPRDFPAPTLMEAADEVPCSDSRGSSTRSPKSHDEPGGAKRESRSETATGSSEEVQGREDGQGPNAEDEPDHQDESCDWQECSHAACVAKHLEEYLADGDFDDPYHEQVFRVARQLRFRLAAERGIDWRELRVNVGIQFLEEHGVHWSAFTPGGEGNEDDGLANLVANWRRVKVGPSDIVETAYARSEEGTDVTAELTTTVGGYPRFCRFMAHLQLARGAEPVVGHQAGFAKLFGVSHRSIGTWLVNGIEDGLWRKTAEHIAPLGKAKGVAARYEVDLGKFPALDAEARRKGTPWRPS